MPDRDRKRGRCIGRCLVWVATRPKGVVAYPGADLDCVVAVSCCLVNRDLLTTTKAVNYCAQDWTDCVGDVVARRRCAGGGALAGTSSNSSEFPFDGA